jgi:hypothetical protein
MPSMPLKCLWQDCGNCLDIHPQWNLESISAYAHNQAQIEDCTDTRQEQ